MKTKMTNIVVKDSTLKRLEDYCNVSGQPVEAAVNEALIDFLDTTAEARTECLAERCAQA